VEAEMLVDAADASLIALLVEDNLADAELIAFRLAPSSDLPNSSKVRIVHVTSAGAAVAALRDSAVKVIILDLSLPDANGLEALHRIRRAAPNVPIIVLTGVYDQASALEALRAGAQDYVLKPPPDAPTLHRILHYALQRQRLLQELDAAVNTSATIARRWRILAEVGKVLAESTNRDTAILQVVKLLAPSAADCVAIYLASDAQALELLEVAHVDEQRAIELRKRLRELLSAPDVHARFESASDASADTSTVIDEALQTVLSSYGGAAGTALPLHFGGRLGGFLLMVASSDRNDSAVDYEFVSSLADRIGLALEQGYLIRQAQLLAAARDRAVGIVSHDLGNSLNTIEICAEALLDPDPPPESGVRNMAELIQRSVTWMRRIAGDLLDKASLDTGLLALNRHSTNVPELVQSAHAMFAPAAEERAMELVVEQADDLPPVDADPDRIMQVLSNLLGNAIKFTPRGGRVVLSTRRVEGKLADVRSASDARGEETVDLGVRFTVSDTGPGIRSEDLAHVFDWFWHAPPPRRGGKGLGLAIAKELVEAHRQSLHVESTLGEGSTFWFTMPAAAAANQTLGNTVD
jgi:signal transduction histidine kinase/DNA-binding NarL/FixJ family response regulator